MTLRSTRQRLRAFGGLLLNVLRSLVFTHGRSINNGNNRETVCAPSPPPPPYPTAYYALSTTIASPAAVLGRVGRLPGPPPPPSSPPTLGSRDSSSPPPSRWPRVRDSDVVRFFAAAPALFAPPADCVRSTAASPPAPAVAAAAAVPVASGAGVTRPRHCVHRMGGVGNRVARPARDQRRQ